MKLIKSVITLAASLGIFALVTPMTSFAQSVDGDTVSWPADGWWQAQHVPTESWDLCNSSNDGTSCVLPPGTYVLINHSTGDKFDNIIVTAEPGPSDTSDTFQQTEEILSSVTEGNLRSGAVMTRTASNVSVRLSMMDLADETAYSVWWVVFNEPGNCLIAHGCSESDVFASPGVHNADQVAAVKISVFYADGFVTGSDGVANVYAHLESGARPQGTFVNFGWSEPVAFGPDANSGLLADNGLGAEIHVVIRTHGPAVAGSVGVQTTAFDGLCDVQACEDQYFAIFHSPIAP